MDDLRAMREKVAAATVRRPKRKGQGVLVRGDAACGQELPDDAEAFESFAANPSYNTCRMTIDGIRAVPLILQERTPCFGPPSGTWTGRS